MDDARRLLTKNWIKIPIEIPNINYSENGEFSTSNRSGSKKGLFNYPKKVFTLDNEVERTAKILDIVNELESVLPENLGKEYKKQEDCVIDGVRGCIDWYIGQWIKTGTLRISGQENTHTMPFRALYVIDEEELFLSSLFRILTRRLKQPHYAKLGQMIDAYIYWELYKLRGNWQSADRTAACLFGMGYEMAKAENELQIIAGKSRTSEASAKSRRNKNNRKKEAIELAKITIPAIRKKYLRVIKKTVYIEIGKQMNLHEDTIKDYLKGENFDDYK